MADYRIDIKTDTSSVQRGKKTTIDALHEIDRTSKGTTDAQKARAQKQADDQAARDAKSLDRTMKNLDREIAASDKRTARHEAASKRLADQQEKDAARASAATKREQDKAFNATFVSLDSVRISHSKAVDKWIADEQKLTDAQARLTRKRLSDDQVALLARNQVVQKSNQQRVDAATKALTGEGQGWAGLKTRIDEATGGVGSMVLGMASFATASMVVKEVGAYWKSLRDDVYDAVKGMGEMRDKTLEIAALKGHMGETTTELREQILFRAETLQTADSARQFQEQMLNVGQASIGPAGSGAPMTQQAFDDFMVKAGRFQAAEGGDAATHGTLAGIMPAMMKRQNITADEAAAEEQKYFNIMQKGGFKFSSGAKQLIDTQGHTLSGTFKSGADQVALLSGLSLATSPEKAGETSEALIRGTTGALARARQPNVTGETMNQSNYLAGLGATEGMQPQDISKLISADLARVTGGAMSAEDLARIAAGNVAGASAPARNAYQHLQHHGYGNIQDIQAQLAFHGLYQGGAAGNRWAGFEARAATPSGLLPGEENAPGFVSANRRVDMFRQSPTAQARNTDLSNTMLKMQLGAGSPEYYTKWEEQAFNLAKAKEPGHWGGDFSGWQNEWAFGGKQGIHDQMMETMVAEARRVGIKAGPRMAPDAKTGEPRRTGDWDFEGIGTYGLSAWQSDKDRASQVAGIGAGIAARGGNVSEAFNRELLELNRKQVQATLDLGAKMGANPLPPPNLNGPPVPWRPKP